VDEVIVSGQCVNERDVYQTAMLWKAGKENFVSTVEAVLIGGEGTYCKDCRKALSKRTALVWVITQGVVAIPYRHFGTNYASHLQG
jgi:hypothetical protein